MGDGPACREALGHGGLGLVHPCREQDSGCGDTDTQGHQAPLDRFGGRSVSVELGERLVGSGENGVQEPFDGVRNANEVADHVGNPKQPREHGADREHLQRQHHRRRRLVEVLGLLLGPAELSAERHVVQPEHVEGGHRRRAEAQRPHEGSVAAEPEGRPEDLVLREEARQRRDAGDGDAADQHRPVRPPHLVLEAAHVAHVLFTRHAVDHRARAEEEQRLEERVCRQVEDGGAEGADAAGEEHVAQLAHRRVRQHTLDVVLNQADRCGQERRQRTDDGHDEHRVRRQRVDGGRARHHVDAGRHHRCGMDQRRHRSWTLHGVGQPHVERDLRALAAGTDEEEEADQGDGAGPGRVRRHPSRSRHHRLEVEAAERHEDEEDAEQEAGIPDAVDDERLLAGVRGALLVKPEADEQVGAQPDPFPADEHDEVVRAQDEGEHREHEEVQVRHVAGVAGVVRHVARGVEVDEKADEGDDEDHHRRQRVHLVGPVDVERRYTCSGLRGRARQPRPQCFDDRVSGRGARLEDRVDRHQERERDGTAGHPSYDRRRTVISVVIPVSVPGRGAEAPHRVEEVEEEPE